MGKISIENISQVSSASNEKFRRSSKISSAMKNQFLSMLLQSGVTIKSVAKHLGINYSTAKVIAKENRYLFKQKQTSNSEHQEEYLPSREKKVKAMKIQLPCCTYRVINSGENLELMNKKEIYPQIQIISTVAWNFLNWGLPNQNHC